MVNRWGLAALVILLAGSFWVWANRIPADLVAQQMAPAPAVGHPAPDFDVTLVGGDSFSLAEARGTPVVINFWATWCSPCIREMPVLERTAQRYADNLIVLGVDQGEDAATIQKFLTKHGITFPIALDEEQAVGADLYNVNGLPTTFFVDAEGVVRRVWMGEMNTVTLEEGILEILN